jgi:hypothetical protein
MNFRPDLGYITIFLGDWQDFDHGKPISMPVPEGSNIAVGDVFSWECAQFNGTAEVLSVEGSNCTVKKLSG